MNKKVIESSDAKRLEPELKNNLTQQIKLKFQSTEIKIKSPH